MTPKKDKNLRIEDEDDWDVWDDEEDDIIDDEDDPQVREAIHESRKRIAPGHGRKNKARVGSGMDPKLRKGIVWTVRIFVVILVVLLLFLPGFPFHDIRETTGINSLRNLMKPYMSFPEWTNASVTLTYDISVSGGRANEIQVNVAPPFDIPFDPGEGEDRDFLIQDVLDIRFSPENTLPLGDWDSEKNRISGWEISDFRGELRYQVTIDMTLHSYQWEIEEEDSGTLDDIPVEYVERYCVNAWPYDKDEDGVIDHYRYEPFDPVINSTAHLLTKDEPTVLGKVRAIYDWMEEHFNYTTPEERQRDRLIYGDYPKWATGCLQDWYGDCDDQSLLMASFCRAVGIPAWLEIGYLYDPSPGREPDERWGGHGWFNVLIPLDDGRDPVIANIDPVNHEFLFRDPYRFTDWIDSGTFINVDGEDIYNLDYYYSYFSSSAAPGVVIESTPGTISNYFEKHGSIKVYTDEPFTGGNLPGTQQEMESLPAPSPLLLAPFLLILIAVPVRRYFLRRD
ncbi:MAG: transglutaminase domain-containing protein [Candidatus Thermoplasmatota archaeon]|nr:transglutaminase domain-containing protein [Candidatus Thermoplasmatota archaeon]